MGTNKFEVFENLNENEFLQSYSDSFWIEFLNYISKIKKPELVFWDFKKESPLEYEIKDNYAKREKNEEMAKDISCFANSESGLLLFGVDDTAHITGVKEPVILANKIRKLDHYFTEVPVYYTTIVIYREKLKTSINTELGNEKKVLILVIAKMNKAIGVNKKINDEIYTKFYRRRERDCNSIEGINYSEFFEER